MSHAEGETTGLFLSDPGKSHHVEDFHDPRFAYAVRLGDPGEVVEGATVGVDGFRIQQGPHFVEGFFNTGVVDPVDKRGARCGGVQPEDHAHGGRFTGAVGPKESCNNA